MTTNPAAAASPNAGASGQARAGTLPDINAATYPFDTVLSLLDQAAFFNMYAFPGLDSKRVPISMPGGSGLAGFKIGSVLHRFDMRVLPFGPRPQVCAANRLGERLGSFENRWMFMPDDYSAHPELDPPPTAFDPSRSQRFSMLEGTCVFEGGQDGFFGFGTGLTYPIPGATCGKVMALAVGDIVEGFGKLAGYPSNAGTYTCLGVLSANGFEGNVLCRAMDPDAKVRTKGPLAGLEREHWLPEGVTWMIVRGQKKDSTVQTIYTFGSDGEVNGFGTSQQLRVMNIDCLSRGRARLQSTVEFGPVIGEMTAQVRYKLFDPGAPGTPDAPIPFASYNTFDFIDSNGRNIGGFDGDCTTGSGEGRVFTLSLAGAPKQLALRFGGFGPLIKGRGCFTGVSGYMTDNSVVGVAPHALATSYVFCIHDPDSRYRAALRD
jgi:hypothetical protein